MQRTFSPVRPWSLKSLVDELHSHLEVRTPRKRNKTQVLSFCGEGGEEGGFTDVHAKHLQNCMSLERLNAHATWTSIHSAEHGQHSQS